MLKSTLEKIITIIIGIVIAFLVIYIVLFGPRRGVFRDIKSVSPVATQNEYEKN
jgi:hypothetical protein